MSEPENVKEKALNVANEAAEKAKNLGQEGMKKADELYNKLPLDKLNEKFGGKIDFSSKSVKYGIFAGAGVIALFILIGIFSLFSNGDTTIPLLYTERIEALISLDDDLLEEYSAVMQVSKTRQKAGEETFGDYVERCKAEFTDNQKAGYEKALQKMSADSIRKSLKQDLMIYKALRSDAPAVISKKFGATCKRIKKINRARGGDAESPLYNCIAVFKDDTEKSVTLRYFINGHEYIDGNIAVVD